jgi:hypothetical protein
MTDKFYEGRGVFPTEDFSVGLLAGVGGGGVTLRRDSMYFQDVACGNVSYVSFGGPGFRVDFSSTDNTLQPREAAEIHPIPASTRPELIQGREYTVKVVCEDGTTASATLKAVLAR